jgi:hypothetical protein
LDADLRVVALEAAPSGAPVLGPWDAGGAGGRIGLEEGAGGHAVLTLRREGAEPVSSLPFALSGATGERPLGLAVWDGSVVLAFGLGGERLGLAVVAEGDVERLLAR